MVEHFTKGIVLSRAPNGEQDATVTIYTKDLGKIPAFTKSIRKPTSKLSGHLVPGNIIEARVLMKNKIQAVDVLSEKPKCNPDELLQFINFLNQVVPQEEPDSPLWHLVEEIVEKCHFGPKTYRFILGALGFGDESAVCGSCKSGQIVYFSLPDIMFLCSNCGSKRNLQSDEIIRIG